MVIATTDKPETLDPTLMSRFICKVHVGRPNEDSRRKFFGLKFNEFIKEEDREAICNLVASQTPGFVWGDLIRTALISLQLAARRDDNYMTMDAVLESLETTKSAFNETEAVLRDHMQHMVNTMDFKYQN
uniref:probable inactive ATP-dependent zinc metalloprotease FTSHI 3, chloroplastic n=1 Tax=Erigeron canadensis TaxID=72917 RepID=UPI001CB8B6CC|nr:probable inactive ATP-dependent zinc metalloprotease FTSHI 3, chloroplastic [Erigeron canadensis]